MRFKELIQEVKGFSCETLRQESSDYFEAVFLNNVLPQLKIRLEKYLGSPVWPSKQELSPKIEKMIDSFGGIRGGQTLYLWNENVDYILAMVWPWKDATHFTIKIFKKVELT